VFSAASQHANDPTQNQTKENPFLTFFYFIFWGAIGFANKKKKWFSFHFGKIQIE
jgi:hypothetical protein